ncbi:MAG: type IV secretion system protein [Pseudomonadota bacterium]
MTKDKKDNSAEKKNWYNDRYEFLLVQRNIFAVITLFALALSIAATFSISQLAPLKSVEPFVIQIDQKSGVTQIVDPVKAKELTAKDAVNNYFIVQYVRARESFSHPNINYDNYNLVRVLSDPGLFNGYKFEIALSNPDSPAARLGVSGSRDVRVLSIARMDSRKDESGSDVVRFFVKSQVTERPQNGVIKNMQKSIIIEFKYVELDLTTEDRYLNPIGFRVVRYQVNDETPLNQ